MGKYLDRFNQAILCTKEFNLNTPNIEINRNIRYLNEDSMERMVKYIQMKHPDSEISDISTKCFSYHLTLQKDINDFFRCQSIYTLGYVEFYDGKTYHKTSKKELYKLLQEDKQRRSVLNIHAWLTLPSMEILDFTFLTTFWMLIKAKRLIGGVILNHADELRERE